MQPINPSSTDLTSALQRLTPQGRGWPRDAGAIQAQYIATLVPTYQRLYARDNNLLIDAFPATADELLPEWEQSLGLPDPCAGPSPTVAARQAQVVARLTMRGGQSISYFTAYAAQLGFTVTVQEYAPARFGLINFEDPMYGPDWAFAWQVTVPGGEAANSGVLECELGEIKPAHTFIMFAYSGALPVDDWDDKPGWNTGGWAA